MVNLVSGEGGVSGESDGLGIINPLPFGIIDDNSCGEYLISIIYASDIL